MGKGSMAGRQAVVTGAAQGIGRAIAERLLSAGARVCLWDADGTLVAEVAKELGENAFAEAVDVAAEVAKLQDLIAKRNKAEAVMFGHLKRLGYVE